MRWLKDTNDDIYDPTYTDMLRVAFTSEFGRGKLQDLVALLSGRNFETKQFEEPIAEDSFGRLKKGILAFINKTHFDRLTMILRSAGFVTSALIGGRNAVNFAYKERRRHLGDDRAGGGDAVGGGEDRPADDEQVGARGQRVAGRRDALLIALVRPRGADAGDDEEEVPPARGPDGADLLRRADDPVEAGRHRERGEPDGRLAGRPREPDRAEGGGVEGRQDRDGDQGGARKPSLRRGVRPSSPNARIISLPPEAWQLTIEAPVATAAAAARPTVFGMSWSFRSRKTRPAAAISRTRPGPCETKASRPSLKTPTSGARSRTAARIDSRSGRSRATARRLRALLTRNGAPAAGAS